jgi:hypothetical protein
MTRLGTSPALLVAGLALVVAVSSGTAAVAASLITGAQIKDRSITAVDVARNALTGVEINESKLGVVPRATTADKLAGVAASGYLRSSRIESGTVDFGSFASGQLGTVFTDPRLQLRVSYQEPAHLFFQNLSSTATIKVVGTGWFASTVYPSQLTLAPGASGFVSFDATGFVYGNFLVTARRVPASATAVLQLTCALDSDVSRSTFSCEGIG